MNIIITGASRGIGRELVKKLCVEGHTVLAISRNGEQLTKLKDEIDSIHGEMISLPLDISSADLKSSLGKVLDSFMPSVDILINNAGILINAPFSEISLEEMQHVYNVNVFGPFRIIQLVVPYMPQDGSAHIVNIGSMGGFQGASKFSGLSIYSSSKQALAGLSECLAEELAEKKIKVNCLALGAAQTEMLEEAFPDYKAPVSGKKMAEYISHFALTAQDYMTGKIIPVALSTP